MVASRWVRWVALVVIVGLFSIPAVASEFATEGKSGTFTASITVTGAGTLPGMAAMFDSTQWSARHTLQFTVRLLAGAPAMDLGGENAMRMEEVEEDVDDMLTEEEEELQAYWDEKLDDCEGDEDCEDRVYAAMMADPRYQKLIAKMQGKGQAFLEKAAGIDMAPRFQVWSGPPEKEVLVNLKAHVEHERLVFGALDTGGGGKVDVSMRYAGDSAAGKGSPPQGVSPVLRINGETRTYVLKIPAHYTVRALESMLGEDGAWQETTNSTAIDIFGNWPETDGQMSAVTFTGNIKSVQKPSLSGKKTFRSDLNDPGDPRNSKPIDVTIEWSFKSD